MAVAAPGGQGDINALLARTSLLDILSKLPLGYFLIGDNAYAPSEHLIPVFCGTDQLNVDNDNANFYFSQCRIRSEMAFGMMTNRFGVLQRLLPVKLLESTQVICRDKFLDMCILNKCIGIVSIVVD